MKRGEGDDEHRGEGRGAGEGKGKGESKRGGNIQVLASTKLEIGVLSIQQ